MTADAGAGPEGARPHSLATEHGDIAFPAFLPDATRAVVRAVDSDDLERCGVPGLVVNTYHLHLNPGSRAIGLAGGIHEFMAWHGPVLSDSGGFQILSLLQCAPDMGSVTGKGFVYRTSPRARKRILTPAKAIQLQFRFGSDIVVCLDHCTHPDAPAELQAESVHRTVAWAQECRREFDTLAAGSCRRPAIFAVVQGGSDAGLRRRCAEALAEIGFDGYGFGGWPVTADGRLVDAVSELAAMLPPGRPRWALGIGKPELLAQAFRAGYDLFDCSLPTRDARHGRLYAFAAPPEQVGLADERFYTCVYPRDAEHARSSEPIDPTCDCLCCRRYSHCYVRHLYRVRDPLSLRLGTIHNLRFYARLTAELRRRTLAEEAR
jgi:queuine tRNA-ribosyltransferase